ncbi:hypothetical protein CCMA1212_000846 [Trichoderma ghanense]|uniref:Uncharacterized protein n=1 Tax=Trichoderma ghanense TaxID=65468 RepID=A0ABY2HHL3_9HYPO
MAHRSIWAGDYHNYVMRVQTRANPTRQHGVGLGRCAAASHFITLAALLSGHCRDTQKKDSERRLAFTRRFACNGTSFIHAQLHFQAVRLHSAMQFDQDRPCGSNGASSSARSLREAPKRDTNRHLSPLRKELHSAKASCGMP